MVVRLSPEGIRLQVLKLFVPLDGHHVISFGGQIMKLVLLRSLLEGLDTKLD